MQADMPDTLAACSLEQADFRGWQAVYLRNGLVSLAAVPDIGGRIMAYDLQDYPYLYVDRQLAGKLFSPEENLGDGTLAAWKNYGGDKTWPAPQGWENDDQWHGPPDPLLDSGRYTLKTKTAQPEFACLEMVSPPDPRSGVQISRKLTLRQGSTRLSLDLKFTNISERQVRWSIWDVVQLQAERELPDGTLAHEPQCVISAPLNPHSRFPKGYQVLFGAEDNSQWTTDPQSGLFVAPYRWEIGKVAIDSPGDWIAFSNNASGHAFIARYTFFPGQEYPDFGATVECWTVGKGQVANLNYENSAIYLMEAEILSPFYDFQPGEARTFSIEWGACRCPGPILEVIEAGCSAEPLSAAPAGDQRLHFKGVFGTFEPGELSLVWIDAAGQPIETLSLGNVSPFTPIRLDDAYQRPSQAMACELRVTARVDQRPRRLARLEL